MSLLTEYLNPEGIHPYASVSKVTNIFPFYWTFHFLRILWPRGREWRGQFWPFLNAKNHVRKFTRTAKSWHEKKTCSQKKMSLYWICCYVKGFNISVFFFSRTYCNDLLCLLGNEPITFNTPKAGTVPLNYQSYSIRWSPAVSSVQNNFNHYLFPKFKVIHVFSYYIQFWEIYKGIFITQMILWL